MAKKKAKKSNLPLILTAACVVLALVSLVMIFVSAVGVVDSETTYTGWQTVFGYTKESNLFGEIEVLKFSFMNLLPYIFVVGAIALAILGALGKGVKLFNFVACGLLIAAGVLFFLNVSFLQINEDATSIWGAFGANIKENLKLGAGAIIAGICAILSGLSVGAKVVIK